MNDKKQPSLDPDKILRWASDLGIRVCTALLEGSTEDLDKMMVEWMQVKIHCRKTGDADLVKAYVRAFTTGIFGQANMMASGNKTAAEANEGRVREWVSNLGKQEEKYSGLVLIPGGKEKL